MLSFQVTLGINSSWTIIKDFFLFKIIRVIFSKFKKPQESTPPKEENEERKKKAIKQIPEFLSKYFLALSKDGDQFFGILKKNPKIENSEEEIKLANNHVSRLKEIFAIIENENITDEILSDFLKKLNDFLVLGYSYITSSDSNQPKPQTYNVVKNKDEFFAFKNYPIINMGTNFLLTTKIDKNSKVYKDYKSINNLGDESKTNDYIKKSFENIIYYSILDILKIKKEDVFVQFEFSDWVYIYILYMGLKDSLNISEDSTPTKEELISKLKAIKLNIDNLKKEMLFNENIFSNEVKYFGLNNVFKSGFNLNNNGFLVIINHLLYEMIFLSITINYSVFNPNGLNFPNIKDFHSFFNKVFNKNILSEIKNFKPSITKIVQNVNSFDSIGISIRISIFEISIYLPKEFLLNGYLNTNKCGLGIGLVLSPLKFVIEFIFFNQMFFLNIENFFKIFSKLILENVG